MIEFCNKVMEFLESQYNDSYKFKIERYIALPHKFAPFNKERVQLLVDYGNYYSLKISDDNMNYLYRLYKNGRYFPERGEFEWQKELIDMIEGS